MDTLPELIEFIIARLGPAGTITKRELSTKDPNKKYYWAYQTMRQKQDKAFSSEPVQKIL